MPTVEHSSPETAERVHRLLRSYAVDGTVSASTRDLAAELSIGRSTALRAIHRLVNQGAISVARRGTGHRYPTTYYVGGL